MKVKVGDKVYDGAEVPIMVILNKGEREQIASMAPALTKYCVYPSEKYSPKEIRAWMADVKTDAKK